MSGGWAKMNGPGGGDDKSQITFEEALAAHRQGRLAAARDLYRQVLNARPSDFRALHLLGLIQLQTGDSNTALEFFQKALTINPRHPEAHHDLGSALLMMGSCEAAIASYERAIELKNDYAEAFYNRGNALLDLHRYGDAIASYDAAIARGAGHAPAYANRGLARACLKEYLAAIADYDEALAVAPDDAAAHCFRADALRDLGRHDAAIIDYDKAIALNPGFAEAFNGRGSAFADQRNFEAAIASYAKAVELQPNLHQAYSNRGNVHKARGHRDAALKDYDRAIALNPEFAEAHFNRADVSRRMSRFDAAMDGYDRALTLAPALPFLRGQRLFVSLQACAWQTVGADAAALAAGIERGEPVSPPLAVLAVLESPSLQRRAAEIWVREHCPAHPGNWPAPVRKKRAKIRIGYFSADFRSHPVASLMAELFEIHDRSRFEVSAFSYGPNTGDAMRKRLESAFDRFLDVRDVSDRDIAVRAQEMELDVAVDLGGFTEDSRPGIFALRAAPLQIGFLGYPGTSGAPYMDYLVADECIIPSEYERFYSEKILRLKSYQPNSTRPMPEARRRDHWGLPEERFVFCCFNTNYKITPAVFAAWMRILAAVPNSVLWLRSDSELAIENLGREAAKCGVNPQRLLIAPRLESFEAHLARYRSADLFLDTFPYGAHTTASDALWAGLPVLTRAGEAFASRVGASLLKAVGIPDLVVETAEQYEELAIDLAGDAPRLAEIRRRLDANRATSALFDIAGYARDLEALYEKAHARYQAALPAGHL
jgi:predicted O-linked N-acetylglucosamine transferase (SPINDLY family)